MYSCDILLFHYFIMITSLSFSSELLHCFNNHSHIHDKIVLIAGATLLHCLNLHCLFIFPINEHKGKIYRTTITSHCMSSSYSHCTCPIHHDITTSIVNINTHFLYFYSNHYSVLINEHKGEYHCTIYFKITVVDTVLCIAVTYCCFIIL